MVAMMLCAMPDVYGYWKVCKVNQDGTIGDAIMTALHEYTAKRWAMSHNEKLESETKA